MAAKTTITVGLQARTDDWDDLTELFEALAEYVPDDRPALYAAVQGVAEGSPATLEIPAARYDEFREHLAEFRIDIERLRP